MLAHVDGKVWRPCSHCCPCLIGEAEALSLGEDKKPILDLYTLTTEERVADDDTDVVIRWATSLGPASTMLPTAYSHAECNVQALPPWQDVLRFRTVDALYHPVFSVSQIHLQVSGRASCLTCYRFCSNAVASSP